MATKENRVVFIPDPRDTEPERIVHEARARRLRAQAFRTVFGGALGALGGAIGHGIRSFKRRRDEAAAYDELAALDDRMLRDLGVQRDEIWSVVRGEPRASRETDAVGTRRRRGGGRPVPGARRRLERREAA